MPICISPEAPMLPANVLRFYLQFPRPGEAHFDRRKLRLIDEAGQVVADPFLLLSQELWSFDGLRLTVLMEPGRIKRGMGADPSHAPALVVGRRYTLELDAMGQTARHAFCVGDAVASPLNEAQWQVLSPTAGSLDPVAARFDRVMDAALCEDEIAVLDPLGRVLPTRAALAADGTIVRLTPRHAWNAGTYRLLLSPRLEDVCGNRLGEALDHNAQATGRPRAGVIVFSTRDRTLSPAQPSSML